MSFRFYDFQVEDMKRIMSLRRCIIGHDKGLGKTLMALTTSSYWLSKGGIGLIVCRKNDMFNYLGELDQLGNLTSNIRPFILQATGGKKAKDQQIEKFHEGNYNVVICHYYWLEFVYRFISTAFKVIVYDEYHKYGLCNRKSMTFKRAKQFSYDSLLLMSATPVPSGPADLWGPLNLIDRKKFSSYWKFVDEHVVQEMDYFTGHPKITAIPKKPEELSSMLKSSYMVRRLKKDLPDVITVGKTRRITHVEMTKAQAEMYNQIDKELILLIENAQNEMELKLIIATAGEEAVRLRQLLVSPMLFDSKDAGGGFKWIHNEIVDSLKDEVHQHFFIATAFRDGVVAMKNYLESKTDLKVYTIMGGMSAKESHEIIQLHFQKAPPERPSVLISTISSAVGFTATNASRGFIIGPEYSYANNTQAEERIYRIGQNKDVEIDYLACYGTIEARVMRLVAMKRLGEKMTLGE